MVVSRRGASMRAPRVSFRLSESHAILIGGCVEQLAELPAESVDLVLKRLYSHSLTDRSCYAVARV